MVPVLVSKQVKVQYPEPKKSDFISIDNVILLLSTNRKCNKNANRLIDSIIFSGQK